MPQPRFPLFGSLSYRDNGRVYRQAGIYLASNHLNVSSLIMLAVFASLYVMSSIGIESKVQRLIPSETRATVSSLQGFMAEMGGVVMTFGFGVLARAYNYSHAFQLSGLVIVGFGLACLLSSWFWKGRQAQNAY